MGTDGPSIETHVGHTGIDEYRFWGRRVFAELLGTTSATQMLVCSMTGGLLDPDDIAIVDDIVTAMSSADARLWPFKIARLGATHGDAMYGVAAALIASEGAVFGAQRFEAVARNLIAWMQRDSDGGLSDEQLASMLRDGAPGFAILYGPMDPRFDALIAQAARRGRDNRPFTTFTSRVARIARAHSIEPHAFAAVCALCLDLHMTPYQIGLLGMFPLFHLALAHAVEGAQQRAPLLQRLPDDYVRYVGRGARTSARAERQHAAPETTP